MSLRVQLARLKRKLLQKPWLKDKAFPGYWCMELLGGKPASVVQIGSNDGKTGDPLHELFQKNAQWRGLFVEPVPYLFERLKANYPDSGRFLFENAAISQRAGKLPFFYVDPSARASLPELPYWFDQLGSFDASRIKSELDGKLEPFVRSIDVEAIELSTLWERHHINHIDLLHIDTEGHDWAILQQLDLERFAPALLLYEYNHLSTEALNQSLQFLAPHYHTFDVGIDVFAVRKDAATADLSELQRHLKPLKPATK